jgi:menaquinone-9 beta-reductase
MQRSDVLIVGGGPAGSSCAWRLAERGLAVTVIDRASFPRDKVCAGWITPAVVDALHLDLKDYARAHTLQPFIGFRTGALTQTPLVTTTYDGPVSYGIRRFEFDSYLLRRSGATLELGFPIRSLRRDGRDWVINETWCAPVVVGAGGHFCPVARELNPRPSHAAAEPVVVAQEIECRLDETGMAACRVRNDCPELFFWSDLMGYGWCVRKGQYLNVGAGRLTQSDFPAAVAAFKATLRARAIVPDNVLDAWKGHAYLLNVTSMRRVHDAGVILAGDAAGLALAPSGEGILAAVESGLMAADAIVEAGRSYRAERFAPYAARLGHRFGPRGRPSRLGWLPGWLSAVGGRALLRSPLLTRRLLIERAFLHRSAAKPIETGTGRMSHL